MDVRCERCKTEYELDDARVTEAGVPVKCTGCGHVFRVKKKPLVEEKTEKAMALLPTPALKEWRIRQPDGKVVALKELTTLQRWIVERKLGSDDEISSTGESWRRLSTIPELQPFFKLLEEADEAKRLLAELTEASAPSPALQGFEGQDPVGTLPMFERAGTGPLPLGPEETPVAKTLVVNRPPKASGPARAERAQPRRASRRLAALLLLGTGAAVAAYGWGFWKSWFSEPPPPLLRPSAAVPKPRPPPETAPVHDAGTGTAAKVPDATAQTLDAGPMLGAVGTPADGSPDSGLAVHSPDAGLSVAPVETPVHTADAGLALEAAVLVDAGAAPAPPAPDAADAGTKETPTPVVRAPVPLPAPSTATEKPSARHREARARDYDSYIAQGDRLRERDRSKAALELYGKAVDMAPDRAEGYAGRGLALLDLGEPPAAEASFLQALKLNPHYGVAIMGLAETYRSMGRKDDAIRTYERYLEVAPTGMESSAARSAIQKLRE